MLHGIGSIGVYDPYPYIGLGYWYNRRKNKYDNISENLTNMVSRGIIRNKKTVNIIVVP